MGFYDDIDLNGSGFSIDGQETGNGFDLGSLSGDSPGIDGFLSRRRETKVISSMLDLCGFTRVGNLLVNKSNRDLWTLKRDANGNFFIERVEEGVPQEGSL